MAEPPSGTVTFLFTDIEGSTELVKQLGDAYGDMLAAHRRLLRTAFTEQGGQEMGTEGDALFYWFPRVRQALRAAVEAQRSLARYPWPEGARIRVRMGLHTGETEVVDSEYVGMGVHRAARVCAAGHGGQVLLSGTTAGVAADEHLPGVTVRPLGEFKLKDIDKPERLSQLVIEGLESDFPPVRAALDAAGPAPEATPAPARESPAEGGRRKLAVAAVAGVVLLAAGGAAAGILIAGGGEETSARTSSTSEETQATQPTTSATEPAAESDPADYVNALDSLLSESAGTLGSVSAHVQDLQGGDVPADGLRAAESFTLARRRALAQASALKPPPSFRRGHQLLLETLRKSISYDLALEDWTRAALEGDSAAATAAQARLDAIGVPTAAAKQDFLRRYAGYRVRATGRPASDLPDVY